MTLLGPGDDILVPDPIYDAYSPRFSWPALSRAESGRRADKMAASNSHSKLWNPRSHRQLESCS